MRRPPKALAWAFFGARGTGKTQGVLRLIEAENPQRLAVFDLKHDPGLEGLGVAYHDLPSFIRALQAERFSVRYLPDHGRDMAPQFEAFCRACWIAGNLLMFVDELPELTKANRAPPAWRKCVNVGREYRGADGERRALSIIGAGQRAAECDKSFISNADVIRCGRLANPDDARQMARMLGVRPEEVSGLPDLHYIEKRASEIEPRRGVLTFGGNTSAPKKPPAAKKTTTPAARKKRA